MGGKIAGSFRYEAKINDDQDIRTINSSRNVVIKNELASGSAWQKVTVLDGKSRVNIQGTHSPQATFNITNSGGRDIFYYILGLDKDAGSISEGDFNKLNEKDLQQKFGKNIKLTKDPTTMKAVIEYNHSTLNDKGDYSVLTIDFETDTEKQAREAEKARERAELQQQLELRAQQDSINNEKARKYAEHQKNLKNDGVYRVIHFIASFFGR